MCSSQRSGLLDALCSVWLVAETLIPSPPELRPRLIMTRRWCSADFLLNTPFDCRLPEISVMRYRMQSAAAISAIFRDALVAAGEKEDRVAR
jgi:hypothetical protein